MVIPCSVASREISNRLDNWERVFCNLHQVNFEPLPLDVAGTKWSKSKEWQVVTGRDGMYDVPGYLESKLAVLPPELLGPRAQAPGAGYNIERAEPVVASRATHSPDSMPPEQPSQSNAAHPAEAGPFRTDETVPRTECHGSRDPGNQLCKPDWPNSEGSLHSGCQPVE